MNTDTTPTTIPPSQAESPHEQPKPPRISVIIPLYNEESTLPTLLPQLESVRSRCEIIFVDGGSTDQTLHLIDDRYTVIETTKGRGNQMNVGAKRSSGNTLFFLHCDSVLPPHFLEEIEDVMTHRQVGCFGVDFDTKDPLMCICQLLSNHRCRYRHIMFGDQGIFIDRELFFALGGFPDLPLMEDYQLSLTLKECGIIPGFTSHKLKTSPRRYPASPIGKLRTMYTMFVLRKLYREGAPIEEIAARYRDIR